MGNINKREVKSEFKACYPLPIFCVDPEMMNSTSAALEKRCRAILGLKSSSLDEARINRKFVFFAAQEWENASTLSKDEMKVKLHERFDNHDDILIPCKPDKVNWVLIRIQLKKEVILIYDQFHPKDVCSTADKPIVAAIKGYLTSVLDWWSTTGVTPIVWTYVSVGVAISDSHNYNRRAISGLTIILFLDALLEQYFWAADKDVGIPPLLKTEMSVANMKQYGSVLCYALATGYFPY
jgi:hypothetical protein